MSNGYSVTMVYPFLSATTKFFLPNEDTATISEFFFFFFFCRQMCIKWSYDKVVCIVVVLKLIIAVGVGGGGGGI